MKPSPEAVAWGKRQASTSPRWSDDKWNRIGTIFGLVLAEDGPKEQEQAEAPAEGESWRDAA
ncbi:hypothetical protein [Actinomadura rubrisoli]|uniref:Uncharacterized protein n=1 Tax=Actinomadura rubrisoli TaxID=2530368 RepID=A0A4R4ZWQ4_9ACTN|nr:hypothetical protein [Actinomadura rubrisoli]TDD63718.1 hypothetical protein E1298_43310 [Actinomadura rubrisoli]